MDKFIIDSEVKNEKVSVEFKPKFLSNKLRVAIFQNDLKFQKKYKKEFESKEIIKKQKFYKAEIDKIESKELPINLKFEEINKINAKIVEELDSIEALEENNQISLSISNENDKRIIEQLQLIADRVEMTTNDLSLIDSKPDSDFWQNANLEQMNEIFTFFRSKYKI